MDYKKVLQKFHDELDQVEHLELLSALETTYLGRNGTINALLSGMGSLQKDERAALGKEINSLKLSIEKDLKDKKKHLIEVEKSEAEVDVTLPGNKLHEGSLHLITYAVEEISRIFEKIGFIRMSYPEVEWEWFSFDALNMPSNHPARDDFETFFLDEKPHKTYGKMVLTPHTSSGQPREMIRLGKPPVRMINIAKTYRPNWDASHVPMFHQFEGLCIDKKINITHLKGTIDYFVKEFFGEKREVRLRPFHFQFTEPSFEVDITCDLCMGTGQIKGSKCKLCKQGWLELGGTGMVHPNVLKSGNLDPTVYSGWAFGFGVERVMMMRPGVGLNNMRSLYDGDIRVLRQF